MAFAPVAGIDIYGTGEIFDADLDDGDWDLNDVDISPGRFNAICARKAQLSFANVQEAPRTARLRVPNTVSDLLSELAEVRVAVATSRTLASCPSASILFS